MTLSRIDTLQEAADPGARTAPKEPASLVSAMDAHVDVHEREGRAPIVAGGRPIMLITEKFPTTWFV